MHVRQDNRLDSLADHDFLGLLKHAGHLARRLQDHLEMCSVRELGAHRHIHGPVNSRQHRRVALRPSEHVLQRFSPSYPAQSEPSRPRGPVCDARMRGRASGLQGVRPHARSQPPSQRELHGWKVPTCALFGSWASWFFEAAPEGHERMARAPHHARLRYACIRSKAPVRLACTRPCRHKMATTQQTILASVTWRQ